MSLLAMTHSHDPFHSHLVKIRLVDELSCLNCCSHWDTSMRFLLHSPRNSAATGNHTWHPIVKSLIIDNVTLTYPTITAAFVICVYVYLTDARSNLFHRAIECHGLIALCFDSQLFCWLSPSEASDLHIHWFKFSMFRLFKLMFSQSRH